MKKWIISFISLFLFIVLSPMVILYFQGVRVTAGYFNPFSQSFALLRVSGKFGQARTTLYQIKVSRIEGKISEFGSNGVRFSEMKIHQPEVEIIEGPDREPGGGKLPSIWIDRLTLENGTLVYRHETKDGYASLHVDQVSGQISGFVKEGRVKMTALGRIAQSGRCRLDVEADLKEPNRDEIKISVEGHDLSSMNEFFKKEANLEMKGRISWVVADLKLSEGQLLGTLSSHYQNLDLKFLDSKDQGKFSAFLKNTVASVMVDEKSEKKGRVEAVKAQRKKDQTIFKFLIEALTPSAQKLITSNS